MLVRLFCLLLLLPIAIKAQQLNENENEFLNRNLHHLSTDKDFSKIDWSFLDEEIKDKRMVAIGEFNHGAKEVFEIRNALISYLHEHHGFNVILFESGMGEILLPNEKKRQISPEKMTKGFFGIWQTQAFAELMAYIQKENMEMDAFDVQRSAQHFDQYLSSTLSNTNIEPVMYKHLESRFNVLQSRLAKESYDTLYHETTDLIQDYRELRQLIWKEFQGSSNKSYDRCRQVLQNRIAYLQYFLTFSKTKDWHQRFTARDSVMAANVEWLAETIYPEQKLILIAHNYHLSKYNEKENVMGELLSQKFRDQYFVIGTFATSGVYAGNNGKEKNILAPDSLNLDLKHLVYNQNGYSYYLSIPQTPESNCQFLFNPITVNDSFINLNKGKSLIPAKSFDALLFVQEVSMPVFLK